MYIKKTTLYLNSLEIGLMIYYTRKYFTPHLNCATTMLFS